VLRFPTGDFSVGNNRSQLIPQRTREAVQLSDDSILYVKELTPVSPSHTQVSGPGAVETRPFCSQWQHETTSPSIIQLQPHSPSILSELTAPPSDSPPVPSPVSFMPPTHETVESCSEAVKGAALLYSWRLYGAHLRNIVPLRC